MSENRSQEKGAASFYIPVEQDPTNSSEVNGHCLVGSPVRSTSVAYSQHSSDECLVPDVDPSESGFYLEDDVDINQRTVTSFGGLSIDTQDSARYYDAPFDCGNIQFSNVHSQKPDIEPKRHYVCIPSDTSSWDVTHFLGTYWRMRSPKIVLSVISGVRHFKPWKNLRLKEQFQKAIIKVSQEES
ncbi:uncharacterized protein LOC117320078 [Pecten maximus]|uniref:uncharacterized protein LOC117320078 n=1 Tax=Pecten maximus TaxID=6579 RepID=UPI001458E25F|nr:uncharacterized protein LOC117320078 [Pecten maximus]